MSYQDKKNQLKGLIKETSPTPLQKVQPVKSDEQWHLNIWVPKDLEKRVKQEAINQDTSIKEVVIEAITAYLERSGAK